MLLNLSLVTEALVNLIGKYINSSPEAPIGGFPSLKISAEPPDKLNGVSTIGLFLYHITEDAHFKNLPALSADTPPLRYTPMGLNLYYQLSAHSDVDEESGIQKEHLLMGLAMKALRDYPIIDDSTEIMNAPETPVDFSGPVFPAKLQKAGNRLRISLLPVAHNEALNYSSSAAKPLRLAVYYQVSVALLEPEQPTLRAGRVLKYGVFTFTRGAPRLDGSRATVTFTMPDQTSASVETQPAEVSPRKLGSTTGGEIIFFGSDLSGDETALLIKNKRFAEPLEVPMAWGVTATDTQIFAVVQPTAGLTKILPGIYSAVARVTTSRMGPGNQMRTFIKTSNEMPFIVTPRIDTVVGPDTSGIVTVTGGVFQDSVPPEAKPTIESIEVFVGPNSLKAGAASNPGEFEVMSATELRFQLPTETSETVPFRVIINGAESAPNWVTAP